MDATKIKPIKLAPKTEEVQYDLLVDGFLKLDYEKSVSYLAFSAIDNFYVERCTGSLSIHTFNGETYVGFTNSYDDIVDQFNFCGCEFEPEKTDK